MSFLKWFAGVFLAFALMILALQRLASERVEVVELHTSEIARS